MKDGTPMPTNVIANDVTIDRSIWRDANVMVIVCAPACVITPIPDAALPALTSAVVLVPLANEYDIELICAL